MRAFLTEPGRDDMTYLEGRSVSTATKGRYRKALSERLHFWAETGDEQEDDTVVDFSLCRFMNKLWLEGAEANVGDYILASCLFMCPRFNKFGDQNSPSGKAGAERMATVLPASVEASFGLDILCSHCVGVLPLGALVYVR